MQSEKTVDKQQKSRGRVGCKDQKRKKQKGWIIKCKQIKNTMNYPKNNIYTMVSYKKLYLWVQSLILYFQI